MFIHPAPCAMHGGGMNWRARPRVNTNHERNLLNNVHLHLLPKYKIYPLNNAVSCLMEKSSEQKNLFGTDATIYKLKSLFWGYYSRLN